MAKDPLAGLDRQVVELPFTGGLSNNFTQLFRASPDKALFAIENADLSQVGKFSNRDGFVSLSNTRIGSESGFASIAGRQMKLFQRGDELGCIADTQLALGSGAGWAGTGDTVYSYEGNVPAPSATGAWKAHGKIPRPTMSCVNDLVADPLPTISDVAVAGRFGIVCWHSYVPALNSLGGGSYGNLYFKVFDTQTNSTVLDTTLVPTVGATVPGRTTIGAGAGGPGRNYQAKISCLAIGNILYCFYLAWDGTTNSNNVMGFYVDMSAANPASSLAVLIANLCHNYCVSTDGSSVFIAVVKDATPNNALILQLTTALAISVGPNAAHSFPTAIAELNCNALAGEMSIAYLLTARSVVYLETFNANTLAQVNTFNAVLSGVVKLTTPDVLNNGSGSYTVTVSGEANGTLFMWARATSSGGAIIGPSAAYTVGGVTQIGAMITINGRVFLPAIKTDVNPAAQRGADTGYYLLEIDSSLPQNGTDLYRTPMLSGCWATDVSAASLDANNLASDLNATSPPGWPEMRITLPRGCVSGNVYYLMTRKGSELGSDPASYFSKYQLEMLAFDFADAYRWASRPYGNITAFSGAVPFAYDGRRTFECGIVARPRIAAASLLAGGSLPDTFAYSFRVVFTWTDASGARWFSAPSYAQRAGDGYQIQPSSSNRTIQLSISVPPVFSGMCAGVDYFANAVEVWVYMTNSAVPAAYFLAAKIGVTGATGYSPVSGNSTAVVSITQEASTSQEQIYVGGGELENSAPPPCRVIEAHRDRLFAISSYDNNVYYTKPKTAGRGIEWCQETQYFTIPEKGLGLASNETCLMIFTSRGVYAIEGYGPSVTGQPAQAFGTLQLLSNQLGLYEVNSCKTTPVGVVFRTNQGWWLVDRTLSLSYIGNDVDGMMSSADQTVAMSVDQERGCIRLLMAPGGIGNNGYVAYNYWYTSQRWSTDKQGFGLAGTQYKDAMVLGDTYFMIDSNDVLARQGAKYGTSWVDGQNDALGHGTRISTGWITVANLAMYKRIWRVIATLENLTNGGAMDPEVSMLVYADWFEVPIFVGTYTAQSIGLGVQTIRAHLPTQKMKAIKIVVEQGNLNGGTNNNPGYNFIGLGFEVGLKNRMSPEPTARSQ